MKNFMFIKGKRRLHYDVANFQKHSSIQHYFIKSTRTFFFVLQCLAMEKTANFDSPEFIPG